MFNPMRILRRRLGRAVDWRVHREVDVKVNQVIGSHLNQIDVKVNQVIGSHLNQIDVKVDQFIGSHLNQIDGLSQQLTHTAASMGDWQRENERKLGDAVIQLEGLKTSLQSVFDRHIQIDAILSGSANFQETLVQQIRDLQNHITKLHLQNTETEKLLFTKNDQGDTELVQTILDKIQTQLADLKASLMILNSRVRAQPYTSSRGRNLIEINGRETLGFRNGESHDYADFEEQFRPTQEELIAELSHYCPWLPKEGKAIDLGAGRGEMVAVMAAHGLDAYGIDENPSIVRAAHSQRRDVRLQKIDDHLNELESHTVSAISLIHVIEHVDTPVLKTWLQQIYRVLRSDGVLIVETPNPHAIDAFKAFWLDVTHVRPYYPEALLFLVGEAGFSNALIWATGDQPSIDDRLGLAGSYSLIATPINS